MMPLFAVICRDKPGRLDTRMATREAHLAWLNGAGRVQLAGPFLQDGNPCGSLLIIESDDIDAARAWAAEDPYVAADVFESVEVMPWRKVIG
jgi:uncharacterized protein YciI